MFVRLLIAGFMGLTLFCTSSVIRQGLFGFDDKPFTKQERKNWERENKAEARRKITEAKKLIAANTTAQRQELAKLLQSRVWNNLSGESGIEGYFVEVSPGSGLVTLRASGNKRFVVPVTQLGTEEQKTVDRILELKLQIWQDLHSQFENEVAIVDQQLEDVSDLRRRYMDAIKHLVPYEKQMLETLQVEDKRYLDYVNSPEGIAAIAASKKRMQLADAERRAAELKDTWTSGRLNLQGRANRGQLVWMRGCTFSRVGTLYKWPDPDRFHITVSDSQRTLFHEVFLSKARFESVVIGLKRGQEIDIQGTIRPALTGQIGGDYAIEVTDIKVVD